MKSSQQPTILRWRIALSLVFFTFWVLGLSYARVLPFQRPCGGGNGYQADCGAQGEGSHLFVVRTLVQTGHGPALDPQLTKTSEALQPPLYYGVVALYAKLSHLADPAQPDQDYRLRSIGVLFGLGSLLAIYSLCRRFLDRITSVLATSGVVLMPMFAGTAGTVNNDMAATFFATSALLCLLKASLGQQRVFDENEPKREFPEVLGVGWKQFGIAGFVTGLALITKFSCFFLLPVWLALMLRDRKRRWPGYAAGLAIALAIFAPIGLGNLSSYGDPLGLGAFQKAFPPLITPQLWTSQPDSFVHWMKSLVLLTLETTCGVFGYLEVYLPGKLYVPILALWVPGIAFGLYHSRKLVSHFRGGGALLLGLATALIGYVVFNSRYYEPHASLLYPAAGVVALLLGYGWKHILDKRIAWGLGAWLAMMVYANAFALTKLPLEFAPRLQAGQKYLDDLNEK